jgi:hypothetical protein
MLQAALANEISVSELAAAWMPSTREVDVKIAFARQAGDEAGHFQLVAGRLGALGFDVAGFRPPGTNPLFEYLRGLSTTIERIAAGLFTRARGYRIEEHVAGVVAALLLGMILLSEVRKLVLLEASQHAGPQVARTRFIGSMRGR